MHNNVISSRDLMDARLQTLYRYERRGRMIGINQWDGVHVQQTGSGPAYWFDQHVGHSPLDVVSIDADRAWPSVSV